MSEDFSRHVTEAMGDEPTGRGPSAAAVPDRIDRFVIREQLGEGGFGVVYRAEQTEPIRREVALKVIRRGMDSEAVIGRFEAERQALAVMEHPGIATVLDAGVAEDGRPFFAMELVRGVPITDYCDRHRLDVRQRVALMVEVCRAVQHAHAKGVIHRDLKPSNILVASDDQGRPAAKVIDFGLAKALHVKLSSAAVHTQQGMVVGTPAYMSPEQAERSGTDVDTRSDVYSLGVVLYELLAGALPFEPRSLEEAGWADLQRLITEAEPLRPSARLSGLLAGDSRMAVARIGAARHTDARHLLLSLRADLDWITMRCLEKDRSQRYQTANELAEDLRRHLAGEAVAAGPPGLGYRLGKAVRRHRRAVAAAAVVGLAVVAGLAGTTWGLVQARSARNDATRRAAELEQVVAFQQRQLSDIDAEAMGLDLRRGVGDQLRRSLEGAAGDQGATQRRLAELHEALAGADFTELALASLDVHVFDRALATVDEQFLDQPLLRARLLQTIADTLFSLGRLDRAESVQDLALSLRLQWLPPDHPDVLRSRFGRASVLVGLGRLKEGEAEAADVLQRRRRTLGPDHPDTLESISAMGLVASLRGRTEDAEAHYLAALEGGRRVFGDSDPFTLTALNNVGFHYFNAGDLERAETFIRQALEAQRAAYGEDDGQTATCLGNLGAVLLQLGRDDEALPMFERSLAVKRRALGDRHPDTLYAISNLGAVLLMTGRLAEAEPLLEEALTTSRYLLGADHPDTLLAVYNMGVLLKEQGRFAEAEAYYRQALEGRRRTLGERHPSTLLSLANTAVLMDAMGRSQEAEALRREERELREGPPAAADAG